MIKKKIISTLLIISFCMSLMCCNSTYPNKEKNLYQDSLCYYFYPESGRIMACGYVINGKKEGLWTYYFNKDSLKPKYSILFRNDTVDGTLQLFDEFSDKTEKYITFYFKKGKCYFSKFVKDKSCIDFKPTFQKVNDLFEALYKEEYVDDLDNEWNHKELGFQNQLLPLFEPCGDFGQYDYIYNRQTFLGGEYFKELLSDLEYICNEKLMFYK